MGLLAASAPAPLSTSHEVRFVEPAPNTFNNSHYSQTPPPPSSSSTFLQGDQRSEDYRVLQLSTNNQSFGTAGSWPNQSSTSTNNQFSQFEQGYGHNSFYPDVNQVNFTSPVQHKQNYPPFTNQFEYDLGKYMEENRRKKIIYYIKSVWLFVFFN
jgi:hypothetical protein